MPILDDLVGERLGLSGFAALMYHAVEAADGAPDAEDYTVSERLFRRHLLAIERAEAVSTPLLRLLAGDLSASGGERPEILITFDDGFESVLTRAAEILGDTGLHALVFITTDKIGQPGYLSPEQVQVLLGMGMVVGSHGETHRYLSDLSLGALREELGASKRKLEALVGYPVRLLSAPGGRADARVVEEARRAGYTAVMGSRPGLIPTRGPLPDLLPRVPITERTTPDLVERLALGEGRAALGELARYKALQVPKRLLGNEGYDLARGVLLGAWRRRGAKGPET